MAGIIKATGFDSVLNDITSLDWLLPSSLEKVPKPRKFSGTTQGDFPLGFLLEEQLEEGSGLKIALKGSFLPNQPMAMGGELNIVKEYYPGNPEAAVQVLQSQESDITIRGEFKAKRFADRGTSYYIPTKYVEALEALRLRGNLMKISLASQGEGYSYKFDRYGFLVATKFDMKSLGHYAYDLTFSIISIDRPSRYPIFEDKSLAALDAKNELTSLFAELDQVSEMPLNVQVPFTFTDALNGLTADLAAIINAPFAMVNNLLDGVESLVDSANRIVGVLKTAKANLVKLKRRAGKIAQKAAFNTSKSTKERARKSVRVVGSNQITRVSNKKVEGPAQYRAMLKLHEVQRIATRSMISMDRMTAQFEKVIEKLPLRTVTVQEGRSLQYYSNQFYGNPDHWQEIYKHNNLTESTLTRGQVLEIPRL